MARRVGNRVTLTRLNDGVQIESHLHRRQLRMLLKYPRRNELCKALVDASGSRTVTSVIIDPPDSPVLKQGFESVPLSSRRAVERPGALGTNSIDHQSPTGRLRVGKEAPALTGARETTQWVPGLQHRLAEDPSHLAQVQSDLGKLLWRGGVTSLREDATPPLELLLGDRIGEVVLAKLWKWNGIQKL
jgi:hypothetical protein